MYSEDTYTQFYNLKFEKILHDESNLKRYKRS